MPQKLAIVLRTQAMSRPHGIGDFIRDYKTHPALRERHVYKGRLFDPATDLKEFNALFEQLCSHNTYQGQYQPMVLLVEVDEKAPTPLLDCPSPTTIKEALDLLPRLLTNSEHPAFIGYVRDRLDNVKAQFQPPPPPAPPSNNPQSAIPNPQSITPTAQQLMQQTAEIPDEPPAPPSGNPQSEIPNPQSNAPDAGELDIPGPKDEAAKPNLSVLKGKVTKAQNALNADPENPALKQALAEAQAALAAAS